VHVGGAGTINPRRGRSPYPEIVNPRARRLIVSGVLGVLLLIVLITALWQART
jgi:hypothetical protein